MKGTDSPQVSTASGHFGTTEDIQDIDRELARKIQEEEHTKALEQQEQERANFEAALKLQKQLDQERKEANDIDWQKIVDQVQERQYGSMIRYQTLKKNPVTVAQARNNMMIYLKNMANYKMTYFKGMSYYQIRPIFKKEYNKVQNLFKKDSEVSKPEKKRIAEEASLQERFKKLRTAQDSSSEPFQEQSTEEPKELSKEDARDSSIKERFTSAAPAEDMEKALWVELKRLYKADKDDILWKLQRYIERLSFDYCSYGIDAEQETTSRRRK
ncbi:hypothetical protein Tco_0533927 [Tanacetum coccineum]